MARKRFKVNTLKINTMKHKGSSLAMMDTHQTQNQKDVQKAINVKHLSPQKKLVHIKHQKVTVLRKICMKWLKKSLTIRLQGP